MAGNRNAVPKQLKPFVKGDPRINRKGRPKTFDAARALAQQIAHEIIKSKSEDGKEEPIVIDGHYVTVAEAVLRSWAMSSEPKLQIAFMEWAFGKVPNVTEVTGKDGGDISIKVDKIDYRRGLAALAPDDDSATTED